MKFIILFYFLSLNLLAQTNCCDSISKVVNKKNIQKKFIKRSFDSKTHDITITIDNSNSANNYGYKCDSIKKSDKNFNIKQNDESFNWNELLKNFISIILALTAGFLALYQMKSNVISSSRIRWNEDLRDALSKFYSASLESHAAYTNYKNALAFNILSDVNHHYEEYIKNMSIFNSQSNKIMMLLNSNELEHKNIEDKVLIVTNMLSTGSIATISQIQIENELIKIVKSAKVVFKKEWDKSKKIFKI